MATKEWSGQGLRQGKEALHGVSLCPRYASHSKSFSNSSNSTAVLGQESAGKEVGTSGSIESGEAANVRLRRNKVCSCAVRFCLKNAD